jgi:hypothetical protein
MSGLRAVIVGLVVAFFATMGAYFYIQMQWSRAMPKQPDPVAGRTHELTLNHGYRVFVSERELRCEWFMTSIGLPLALAAFAVAAGLNQRYHPFSSRRDQ